METVTSDHALDFGALIDLSSQIASRGYGAPVIELALFRKGVPREVARLVAVSAIGCRNAILAAQTSAAVPSPDTAPAAVVNAVDIRAARAANRALSKIVNFLVLIVAGFCVGVLMGWGVGFGHGVEDGLDWIVRAIEPLASVWR